MSEGADQAAIAEWLAANKPTRLPKRSATAPPILAIRAALSKGKDIEFTRGRSGRTVTFKSASVGGDKILHDEGMTRRLRRKAAAKRNTRRR